MSYLFFTIILTLIMLSTVIAKKINIVPITVQLISTILFIVLLGNKVDINQIKSNLKLIYEINFVLILYYIFYEIQDLKITKKVLKISSISFFIPFIFGIIMSISLLGINVIKTEIVIGLLCSITAVPVLYLYLKDFNYEPEKIKLYLSVAILIDLLSWSIFSILSNNISIQSLLITFSFGLLPILLKYIKCNKVVLGLLFYVLLLIADRYKLNLFLIGIIFILSVKHINSEIELPLSKNSMSLYKDFFAVPFILLFGFLQVKFPNSLGNIDLLIVVVAILIKCMANYIAISITESEKPIKEKIQDAVLLNIRGLTEVIFLNMLYSLNYIDERIYIIFIIISIVSNLLPIFFKNSQEKIL